MIIEFVGNPTDECKRKYLKNQLALQSILAVIMAVIFLPISIVILIFGNVWIGVSLVLLTLAITGFSLLPGKKVTMPKSVTVDTEEGVVIYKCEKAERFHLLEEIEAVLDFGEWYEIHFKNTYREIFFCQKNLITQGTLEEFEKLFEDKIERRITKSR